MYAPDLSTECECASGPAVRAIGWLEHGQPFDTGSVDPGFLAALKAHVADAGRWLPVISPGVHFCDLGGCGRTGGAHYVIIPAATCVYVAPALVVHYVEHHRYAPPPEFVAAILACPEQSSDAYVELLTPFASTWRLDADGVRRIAATAPGRRKAHAEAEAQREASKGGFKW